MNTKSPAKTWDRNHWESKINANADIAYIRYKFCETLLDMLTNVTSEKDFHKMALAEVASYLDPWARDDLMDLFKIMCATLVSYEYDC